MNQNRLVVLGAGESGVGAAILAKKHGFDVFVSDKGTIGEKYSNELRENNIDFEEGKHSSDKILNAHEIVKSPGIPDKAPLVVEAKLLGISVISEIEFASRYTSAKKIAITGSNGKTTTTLLTYHILQKAGYKVGLAGNIGKSFARQVATEDFDHYVLELSSFQLDGMFKFKAEVAILLNITPDHLDRYEYKFENYIDSKFRIAQNQTNNDYFISFIDDEVIQSQISKREINGFRLAVSQKGIMLNGAFSGANEQLNFNVNNHITRVFGIDESVLPLRGKHNEVNTMMAVLAATVVGVDDYTIEKALPSFKNADHRLQEISRINGVRYINDSKATNVDSVKYALDSFEKPIIWIAGGVDKGNDYSVLEELVYEKVKAIICLGKDNESLKRSFSKKVPVMIESDQMSEAVRLCFEMAEAGDHVLLSPACASFDLFNNYEDRGNQFMAAVEEFKNFQKQISNN